MASIETNQIRPYARRLAPPIIIGLLLDARAERSER
jgi:hypothetical protein